MQHKDREMQDLFLWSSEIRKKRSNFVKPEIIRVQF